MDRFKVMESLAPYADTAKRFTATGQGQHREGLVVSFCGANGNTWVGNFQPGLAGTSTIVEHPDGKQAVVVSQGQGYIVDPDTATVNECFGGQLVDVIIVTDLKMIVFGNGFCFDALGPSGWLWRTRPISWDGMRNLIVTLPVLTGESWSYTGEWNPFTVNLTTGRVVGGSYGSPVEK